MKIGVGEAVVQTTTSASEPGSPPPRRDHLSAEVPPAPRARSRVRLATGPGRARRLEVLAESSAISPPPMSSTVLPSRPPKMLPAICTAAEAIDIAARPMLGLGAHPLGAPERRRADCEQLAPGGAQLLRPLEGVLHLAEDLRLADDHRVEAGGDPEQVDQRRLAVVL